MVNVCLILNVFFDAEPIAWDLRSIGGRGQPRRLCRRLHVGLARACWNIRSMITLGETRLGDADRKLGIRGRGLDFRERTALGLE